MMKRVHSSDHTRDVAEQIGQQGLLFLAEDPVRLQQFLTKTGLDPGDLYARAGTVDILAAVLEHLLADESQLLVFTATADIEPIRVAEASRILSGASLGDGA